jgi:hypothetical protein
MCSSGTPVIAEMFICITNHHNAVHHLFDATSITSEMQLRMGRYKIMVSKLVNQLYEV